MKPREEVKWALKHRLQQQRAEQEEIEEYMQFLDAQMDVMISDPAADKEFLGNTYSRDSNGNESVSIEGGATYHSESGVDVGVSGGGSYGRDGNGDTRAEGHVRADVSYGF